MSVSVIYNIKHYLGDELWWNAPNCVLSLQRRGVKQWAAVSMSMVPCFVMSPVSRPICNASLLCTRRQARPLKTARISRNMKCGHGRECECYLMSRWFNVSWNNHSTAWCLRVCALFCWNFICYFWVSPDGESSILLKNIKLLEEIFRFLWTSACLSTKYCMM